MPRYDGHLSIWVNQGGEPWRRAEGVIRPSTTGALRRLKGNRSAKLCTSPHGGQDVVSIRRCPVRVTPIRGLCNTVEIEPSSTRLHPCPGVPGVATVDAEGRVTAVDSGTATVTDTTATGVSGSAAITVAKQASSVEVDPGQVSLTALGETAALKCSRSRTPTSGRSLGRL